MGWRKKQRRREDAGCFFKVAAFFIGWAFLGPLIFGILAQMARSEGNVIGVWIYALLAIASYLFLAGTIGGAGSWGYALIQIGYIIGLCVTLHAWWNRNDYDTD